MVVAVRRESGVTLPHAANGEEDTVNEHVALTAEYEPSHTVESWPLESVLESISSSRTRRGSDPNNEDDDEPSTCYTRTKYRMIDFYHKFDFPIHVLCVIFIAWCYPPLGAVYVAPAVTANWVAVIYIFVLFGLGVRTEEFSKALTKMRFNALVQIYNFGFISSVVFGVSRLLILSGILERTLADGMAICSCLPMSINVGIVLTMASGGDEAVAIFNTSFGNFVGVFLSPALILGYLGENGQVNVGQIYMKLSLIVILPLIIGQLIQRLIKPLADFYFLHKKTFKKTAEWSLVFIIFTIFSRNFYAGLTVPIGQVFIMIAFELTFICSFMAIMWQILKLFYPNQPLLRVTGTFISIQKTIALGVPLITSIYGSGTNLAFYTLPILVWHPMQLIMGSALVPRMSRFIVREKERLAAENDDDSGDGVQLDDDDNNGAHGSDEDAAGAKSGTGGDDIEAADQKRPKLKKSRSEKSKSGRSLDAVDSTKKIKQSASFKGSLVGGSTPIKDIEMTDSVSSSVPGEDDDDDAVA